MKPYKHSLQLVPCKSKNLWNKLYFVPSRIHKQLILALERLNNEVPKVNFKWYYSF